MKRTRSDTPGSRTERAGSTSRSTAIGTKPCVHPAFRAGTGVASWFRWASMGFRQLSQRWRTGQQLIQTNGITYNVYGDPARQGAAVADGSDSAGDRSGRSGHTSSAPSSSGRTLLNSMLADLYGPQKLMRGPFASARDAVRQPAFSAPLLRHRAAGRRLPAHATRPIWRVRPMATGG